MYQRLSLEMPASVPASAEQLARLRQALTNWAGHGVSDGPTAAAMAARISQHMRAHVSATTIKRLFGHVAAKGWSAATLNLLAQATGSASWTSFAGDTPPPYYSYQPDPLAEPLARLQGGELPFAEQRTLVQLLAQHGTAADFQRLLHSLEHIGAVDDPTYAYPLRNLLGCYLRHAPRMQHLALLDWAHDEQWQRLLLQWFVDEAALHGYYGQMLQHWTHSNRHAPSQHFAHSLLLKQALERDDAPMAQGHADQLSALPVDFAASSSPWPLGRSITYRMVWAHRKGRQHQGKAIQALAEDGLAYYRQQPLSSWDQPTYAILLADAYLHTHQPEAALALATETASVTMHSAHRTMLTIQQAEAHAMLGETELAKHIAAGIQPHALQHQPAVAPVWERRYDQLLGGTT